MLRLNMATINHTNVNVPLGWPVTVGTQIPQADKTLQVLTPRSDLALGAHSLEPLFLGLIA